MTYLKLSKDFTLAEMLISQDAVRHGFSEQFTPDNSVVKNLDMLVSNILQPLRDAVKAPIYVSSGYRCERVNLHIGGAENSQHILGQAADLHCYAISNEAMFYKILEIGLPFDQLINEFNFAWVHVSYSQRHRKQILEAVRENGKTIYKPFV
jgi:zinc D-Ala-D-Ala carboxypeptidase